MAKAKLVKWTKGFCCSGVENEDVCDMLRDALKRRGDVKIELCAILNDTTGKYIIGILVFLNISLDFECFRKLKFGIEIFT